MSRRHVTVTPMMEVNKKVHKDLGGGILGLRQIRKTTNTVRSKKLAARNSCVAGKMAGKTFASLGAVQDAFGAAVGECKAAGK